MPGNLQSGQTEDRKGSAVMEKRNVVPEIPVVSSRNRN